MKWSNFFYLLLGILLLFASVYLFTRPAAFDSWNLSTTGQIGDTIGGITGPIINFIGAFLVYISFKEQITANRIQISNLKVEKNERLKRETYDRYFSQIQEIKSRLHSLQFVVRTESYNPEGRGQYLYHRYEGMDALNEVALRLEEDKKGGHKYYGERYTTYSTFLNYHFILTSTLEAVESIENKVENLDDKEFLMSSIKTFYKICLMDFGVRLLEIYPTDDPDVLDLQRIKKTIDAKFQL